ncbi:MAG: NADH-quinone oxidoreductase subunit I [Verrucomicrobia bacterium]|nr:MAG: NADH-quinone oxidoreductase subunit I [Verrucomicrobiota bacterium]TAE89184.1 MAG: NADH-quinone oxidoreductase subunit I [Verrucomicrobiota bacterium]TAF27940.1 MAG: NADH-quinone oxidoreductase subunit I [Verrucomicrobiota bacterium]TAF42789.1 MAG: NADH-quinone oxidoreductase subunit I [Verrucomicrobiota bacterium]
MAVVKVTRPKLNAGEKMYLGAIFKGFVITMKHAIASMRNKTRGADAMESTGLGITMQYPEQKWDGHLPDYYRGAPALVTDEQDRERCVSCQLCEFICPPKAIKITPGEIPSDDPWAKVEKRPKEFEIDMTRCIYCGMCEEVCPEQAIYLRKDYAITGLKRADMVHNKKKLYEIGGKRVGLVNKWNELK